MAFDKRTSTPTVFEQQREELVREIAVVRLSLYLYRDLCGNKNRAWSKSSKTSTGLIGTWKV